MGPRDVDAATRAFRIKAFSWGAYPGLFIGAVVMATSGLVVGLITMVAVTAFVGGGALLFASTIGVTVEGMTNPGAAGPRRSYSRAEALLVRGEPQAALDHLEARLAEDPDDAGAMLRVARIHRDALDDPESALRWLRKGRASGCFTDAEMRVSMREIMDLSRALGDPTLAAPDLARQRDHFSGSPEGEWAEAELAEVKRSIER